MVQRRTSTILLASSPPPSPSPRRPRPRTSPSASTSPSPTATPTYRASGWIYGMTENGTGPADHFFRDVKFRYMRAGGAQLDSPAAGCRRQVRPPVELDQSPVAADPCAGRRVRPAAPRPVGRRRVPDLPFPRRQRQLDRLRQLPHPPDRRRAGDRRPGRSGTCGTSPTSRCSGTGRRPSTSNCGGAPTSASARRSRHT